MLNNFCYKYSLNKPNFRFCKFHSTVNVLLQKSCPTRCLDILFKICHKNVSATEVNMGKT